MSKKIKLHQYLTKAGIFISKGDVYTAIKTGKVTVNGRTVRQPTFDFKKKEIVEYNGKQIKLPNENIYILMNKPKGYLSSKLTKQDFIDHKKSIFSLLIRDYDELTINSLFCVGRLDEDSSGLIIITNDGNLSYKISQPKSKIIKTYIAELKNTLTESDIQKLENGIEIELEENGVITKYKTNPSGVKFVSRPNKYQISITEGKKRQVKRMILALGNKVLALKRIEIGNINLSELSLKEGEYKVIDKEFIDARI